MPSEYDVCHPVGCVTGILIYSYDVELCIRFMQFEITTWQLRAVLSRQGSYKFRLCRHDEPAAGLWRPLSCGGQNLTKFGSPAKGLHLF